MKAYLVNNTEFYAATNFGEAETLHLDECSEPAFSIELADLTTPWRIDGSPDPETTLCAVMDDVKEPRWLGSTEI